MQLPIVFYESRHVAFDDFSLTLVVLDFAITTNLKQKLYV